MRGGTVFRFAVGALVALLVAGCGGANGSGVRVAGELELARDEPVMAVEFEASFESLVYSSGVYAQLYEIRPDSAEDLAAVKTFRRELWDGKAWVPSDDEGSEISGLGVNTFRFRWVLELADGVTQATIPFEVEINAAFLGGSDMPPPEEDEVTGLELAVTSSYPLD